ncbi:hypothetical protein [Burkholderia metallica]|nr:hypothetical protein [Burkholderia metallica]
MIDVNRARRARAARASCGDAGSMRRDDDGRRWFGLAAAAVAPLAAR